MRRRIQACWLLLLLGCGPKVEDSAPDYSDAEVVRDACESVCMTGFACCDLSGRPECFPMHGVTEEECVEDCVGSESEWGFSAECRDAYYANVDCASTLTCEEYVEYYKGTPGHVCEAEREARREMVEKGCFGS
ncbi:MAG: hypothetical protein ACE37F_03530 [Nannocystaceae bacterium]|nr:hypothetical protein [bacterium]